MPKRIPKFNPLMSSPPLNDILLYSRRGKRRLTLYLFHVEPTFAHNMPNTGDNKQMPVDHPNHASLRLGVGEYHQCHHVRIANKAILQAPNSWNTTFCKKAGDNRPKNHAPK